jgi:hypothetical protein
MVRGLKVSSACRAMTHSNACALTVLRLMCGSIPGSAASTLTAAGLHNSAMLGLPDCQSTLQHHSTRGSTAAGAAPA